MVLDINKIIRNLITFSCSIYYVTKYFTKYLDKLNSFCSIKHSNQNCFMHKQLTLKEITEFNGKALNIFYLQLFIHVLCNYTLRDKGI